MITLKIKESNKLAHIQPEVYGHFSEHLGRCIYEGIFVGKDSKIPNENGMRKDTVEALKELKVPLLRWPGGCFADEYHWKDGIGPKEDRKKMINTHWGGVLEDNSFGTHEFMELCRQIGCKTYVNGNLGSGTVQEMSEWLEYMTFDGVSPMADLRKKNGHEAPWRVDYFGVGNENWGCGGNMTPTHYANEYRRYQTYLRQYDPEKPVKKICGGPNADDTHWTEDVVKTCFDHVSPSQHGFMDLLSIHYYVFPDGWDDKVSATKFDTHYWYKTLKKALYMDDIIRMHEKYLDEVDPDKKVGFSVDEWGTWYQVEEGTNPGFLYQQNTMRDALVAGVTLNIFNKHADRVRLACLAQMVNVLQAVLLTEGPQLIKTPTYHVLHMYRHHQDADLVESQLENIANVGEEDLMVPEVTESVSVDKDGILTVTLSNLDESSAKTIEIFTEGSYQILEARVVASENMQDHNTFDKAETVTEKPFEAAKAEEGKITLTMPRASVVTLRLTK